MTHLDTEYKLCPGCATEQRIKHYNDLLRQERGIIAFLRLTQFIFMVSVILFAADRFSYDLYFEVLSANIFHEYLFLWAGASIFCVIVCYILLFLQKQKMRLMEDKIQDHRISSRYMRR